ncbi:hypothetical protein EV356DRAFT_271128 [Viridothelium virens]|uniref:Uncharacterized protein n=1 Tax=Viridothelium virens TaxID=1048519 RepID=A0A6A6H273_VIRVR|nr:hypothetical protein EV356DRAFT_271128 [Viridothelium virens]
MLTLPFHRPVYKTAIYAHNSGIILGEAWSITELVFASCTPLGNKFSNSKYFFCSYRNLWRQARCHAPGRTFTPLTGAPDWGHRGSSEPPQSAPWRD